MGLLSWFEFTGTCWNASLFTFIFGSTLVIYNLNMISGLRELREMGTDSERHHWCMENERLMKLTLALGLALAGSSVWFLNHTVWFLMIPLALVAVAYAAPIVRQKTSAIRIREIGLWKIFIIAAVWAGMTVILPAVHLLGFEQLYQMESWQLAIERSIFILAITIPFDIRDLVNDAKKKVRTLPSVLGWKRAVLLAVVLLLLFEFLVFWRVGKESTLLIGYLLSASITLFAVGLATPQRNDMYCSFWIEGTMLLQFALVVAWA